MHKAQHGFAIVAAIFLLVILAALGAFMVTFSNSQHITSAQDIQGSRAYWSARAGIEWAIASTTTTCPTSPKTLTINTFTVIVTCSQKIYTEADSAINIFNLTSVASTGTVGGIGFIERSVSASIQR